MSEATKSSKTKNNIDTDVKVVADFSSPCPHCGANCTGEIHLWYIIGTNRISMVVDRQRFDRLLESAFELKGGQISNYQTLPKFIQEYNECVGWAQLESPGGEVLDVGSLEEALAFLHFLDVEDQELLVSLSDIVQGCRKTGCDMWISLE